MPFSRLSSLSSYDGNENGHPNIEKHYHEYKPKIEVVATVDRIVVVLVCTRNALRFGTLENTYVRTSCPRDGYLLANGTWYAGSKVCSRCHTTRGCCSAPYPYKRRIAQKRLSSLPGVPECRRGSSRSRPPHTVAVWRQTKSRCRGESTLHGEPVASTALAVRFIFGSPHIGGTSSFTLTICKEATKFIVG